VLLKHAYYKEAPEDTLKLGPSPSREKDVRQDRMRGNKDEGENFQALEVLPNIDINIKQGNSLVSRFELDADLSSVFSGSKHSVDDYKQAVRNYKQTKDRDEKRRLQQYIDDVKDDYSTTLINNRPINEKLSKARGRLELMHNADLFGDKKVSKKEITTQEKEVKQLEETKAEEESGVFYNQAFEWRFEFPEVLDEDGIFTGFDAVIGNPPYIDIKSLDESITKYLSDTYDTVNNRINVFSAFLERSLNIINRVDFGLSFILPTALATQKTYKKIRELITQNYSISTFVRLPNEVFGDKAGDVKVDTAILVLSELNKTQKTEIIGYAGYERIDKVNSSTAFLYSFKDQNRWLNDDEYIWRISTTESEDKIIEKCENDFNNLEDLTKICLGLTPYDKYRGQTQEQIKNRVFHADHKKDKTFKKLLAGKDVKHYSVIWNQEKWISYGDWLGAPRKKEFYNTQNAFNILKDSEYDLEYVLGILNSKLMTFYHRKKFLDEFKMRFQKILIRDCRRFPIKKIEFDSNDELKIYNSIKTKVNQILTAKKDNPETDTREQEAEIDRLVYALYGLSEEEIEIVEESLNYD
jgi:hypothetical protein